MTARVPVYGVKHRKWNSLIYDDFFFFLALPPMEDTLAERLVMCSIDNGSFITKAQSYGNHY